MQIVRYAADGVGHYGILDGETVRSAQGDPFTSLVAGPAVGSVDSLTLLPPVVPSKILAIGLNYHDHIQENVLGDAREVRVPDEPVVFMKPVSALIGNGAPIVLPRGPERIDAEAELAIVIGKRCRHVAADHAWDVILGLTVGNDVSVRDYQKKDGQWIRAKGFDTFAPLGPAIVTDIRSDDLPIWSKLNGEIRQSSSTKQLIFNVPTLVAFISRVMTLEPGDVIMTGTPAGVPQLNPGDTCEIGIDGIGVLRNPVMLEEELAG
jgi:2-keto-4-pentenoate hydratase/2-oxohepta-3-ene-1,7-dioic acid hydratase in catechol pathway